MLYYFRDPGRFLDFYGPQACCGGVFLLLLLLAGVLATATALGRVARDNRRMSPAQVWLNLIPVFNLIWLPVTVERVGESLRAELADRGRFRRSDGYGKAVGLTALALYGTALVYPPAAVVTWPFAFIYTIVYWVQLGRYARRLRDDVPRYTPPADEGW